MIETNEELITQKVAQSLDFTLNPLMEPEKRKSPPVSIKKKIESSHGRLCPLCGIKMVHTPKKGPGRQKDNEATWEHVLDLSLGGSNHLENSTIICFSCNAANNSVMLEYIGQFGLRFGNLEWKEEFNRDRRNLVRLHRFVDWKTRSVLSGRTDVYQELHRMWSRYRWGNSVYVNDSRTKRTHVNDSRTKRTHGRGVIRRIFDNILSLFQRDENVIPEIADTPSVVAKPASTTIIPEEPTVPSDNQEMRWTDLDKGSLDDLGKLLVHLIGSERMIMSILGSEIAKFQSRNNLSGSGSKDLFREFGITVTSKTTLKGVIVENFSDLIHVDQVSPVQCYYSVVDKQDLLTIPLPTR